MRCPSRSCHFIHQGNVHNSIVCVPFFSFCRILVGDWLLSAAGKVPVCAASFLCRHLFCACLDGYVVVEQNCRHAQTAPEFPRGDKSASLVSLVSSSWPPWPSACVWMYLSKGTCCLEMLCCAETNASRLCCVSPTQPSLLCLVERKPGPFPPSYCGAIVKQKDLYILQNSLSIPSV